MSDTEKKAACQEAWELRSRPVDPCNEIKTYDNRDICVRKIRRLNGIGLMNYLTLDCTRVGLTE